MSDSIPNYLKKQSHKKKPIHLHFVSTSSEESDDQKFSSIASNLLKRQGQIVQQQLHKKIHKKIKAQINHKSKVQQEKPIETNNQIHQIEIKQNPPSQIFSSFGENNIEQQKLFIENQAITLLQELLFHPDRLSNSHSIINTQVLNNWILSDKTHKKIKSCLILYMILYKFDHINWYFSKKIYNQTGPFTKNYSILKKQNKIQRPNQNQKDLHEKFKRNQFSKYLIDYMQWLIWMNQTSFQTSSQNPQFWAMALNNCEPLAFQLMRETNPREKQRSIYLALYLMNAEDSVFKSTLTIPIEQQILIYMKNQNLQLLPSCHWVLGLNICLKYFYQSQLQKRVKQALIQENIDTNGIKDYYLQYFLLQRYFNNQNVPFLQGQNFSLTQKILKCILLESQVQQKHQMKQQKDLMNQRQKIYKKQNQAQIQDLLVQITLGLLQKQANRGQMDKKKLLIVLELFQREKLLKKKQNIINQILYEKHKLAVKVGNQKFSKIIDQLQHKHETTLPNLFQSLVQQYNYHFKHLISADSPNLKYDLLAQLEHLIQIKTPNQNRQIFQRIYNIFFDFNIVAHWNKKRIVQRLAFQLQNYLCGENIKFSDEYFKKAVIQLQILSNFLKISLKIVPITFQVLRQIISFIIKVKKNNSKIAPPKQTINFIKQTILSQIFGRTNKYQQLLVQIKKQKQENKQQQGLICLIQLKNMAQQIRIPYFSEQINIVKTLSIKQ